MATVQDFPVTVSGAATVTATVLQASGDDLIKTAKKQVLVLDNRTGGPVTVTLLGDLATTVTCPDLGDPIDVSGGYSVVVADSTIERVLLGSISAFLKDSGSAPAITCTAPGVEAYILTY